MTPHPDDTIVAVASAGGSGSRAILRLSGSRAWELARSVFAAPATTLGFSCQSGIVKLQEMPPLPAQLLLGKGPRTYTGQDTAEIHVISSPPLLDLLTASLIQAGARAAVPGEFTMRSFLAGKRDLPQAEAVLAVIESGSRDELTQALLQLAGGITQPLQGMREDVLNLLADVEAGLDFSEERIEFVGKADVLLQIGKGLAQLTNLRKQIDERSVSGRPFRVAIVGVPNAGKSSLFNALAGLPAAIVSPIAGTTRDYVTRSVQLGGSSVELIDTAGWRATGDTIEEQAQSLGRDQARRADLLLWCLPPENSFIPPTEFHGVPVLAIRTKIDRGDASSKSIATSARSGFGIERLRKVLRQRAVDVSRPSLVPSLSRCRAHVDACTEHLRRAHGIVLNDDPAELLAMELRLALDELGAMVGAVYTDDLLDRVFSRFCIGK